jgi:hypothetical protein
VLNTFNQIKRIKKKLERTSNANNLKNVSFFRECYFNIQCSEVLFGQKIDKAFLESQNKLFVVSKNVEMLKSKSSYEKCLLKIFPSSCFVVM